MAKSRLLLSGAVAIVLSACTSTGTIRTQRLELVDDAGRVRAVLGIGPFGSEPSLVLMDEDSEPLAMLGIANIHPEDPGESQENVPMFHLESKEGNGIATLMTSEGGGAHLLLGSADRELSIEIDKQSTVITTVDGEGHEVRAKLLVDKGALRLEPIPDGDKKRSTVQSHLSPRDLDVLEAVFRYQFEHNASGPSARGCYFLELADKHDPPHGLLARFAGNSPPVEPLSAADPDVSLGVHHKGMSEYGTILRLTSLSWIDDNTVELDGGYYSGNRSSSRNTYRAERRDGKWVVVSDKRHWIS